MGNAAQGQDSNRTHSDRRRLSALCLLYVLVMLYSSTVIGPSGINFVYRDPLKAFRSFLATPYVTHGSDQRADWVGNLLMLIPFGFLVAAALRRRSQASALPATAATLLVSGAVILAIKYIQLFFPPRTVTLNYILAQSLGAVIGCAAYGIWQRRIVPLAGLRDPVNALVLGLRLYAGTLFLFILMPLDFALDATDLHTQLRRLPQTVWALPGDNHAVVVRVITIAAATAAFVPVGMLLTFVRAGRYKVVRGLPAVAGYGLLITGSLYGLATLVISAFPVMPSILYRTGGVVAGAAVLSWLVRQDPDVLRRRLRRFVPWAVLPYLLCLLLVNRLLSTQWLSFQQAATQAYPLGFLPLFDYYIVTKAEAAKNIVGHFAAYLPVGIQLWARYDKTGVISAFCTAAVLSLSVESARFFRPGLQADINAVVVAGLAGALSVKMMPLAWRMLLALQRRQDRLRIGVTP